MCDKPAHSSTITATFLLGWRQRVPITRQKFYMQWLLSNKMIHSNIYSCPMKTHHSSDAHICCLSKAVQNFVIYNYYLGQIRLFLTVISTLVTPLTHDVTSASKLRYSHFGRIQKYPKISFKCFLFASRSPVISPQL